MEWKINIYEKHCTGCRICQMICSWANEGDFHPAKSMVKIASKNETGAHFSIRYEPGCSKCGLCATYCTSKALVREKR